MNLQKIEQLIEKYDNGESSLDEERLLKDYFLNEDTPVHLLTWKKMFTFYELSKRGDSLTEDFDHLILTEIQKKSIVSSIYRHPRKYILIFSLAASIIILLGWYFGFGFDGSAPKETYSDPELAYAETKKILLKVSNNLNSGINGLKSIEHFDTGLNELNKFTTFQAGLDHLEKISILDKTKEILTTKNQIK